MTSAFDPDAIADQLAPGGGFDPDAIADQIASPAAPVAAQPSARELGDNPADLLPVSPGPTNEEAEQEKDAHVRSILEGAQAGNPTHELEAYHLSQVSGAPQSMVRDRLDDFRKSYKAAGIDTRAWRLNHPDLDFMIREFPHMAPTIVKNQQVFRKVVDQDYVQWEKENPTLGAIVHGFKTAGEAIGASTGSTFEPEVGTKLIEFTQEVRMQDLSHLTTGEATIDALKRGARNNLLAKLGAERAYLDQLEPGSEKAQRAAEFVLEQTQALGRPAFYGDGLGVRAATAIAETTTGQADSAASLLAGGAVGLVAGPEIGALAAKMTAAPLTFITEMGGFYNDNADARDDKGNPIDKGIVFAAAHLYGIAATAAEMGALGIESKGIPALDKTSIKRMLTDRTKRGVLLDLAKTLTKDAGTEGAEGGTQQAMSLTIAWLAKNLSAREVQDVNPDQAGREIVTAFGQEALGSVIGIGAPKILLHTAQQFRDIGAAHRAGAHVAAITEVGKTDAAQAAPQQVAAFIAQQQQRDGRKVTHLYIDPTKVHEFAEKGGVDLKDVATELMGPDGPQRLQDALDVHGDADGARATLEVPLAEYLEKWGGKPIADALVEDISTGPGLQTMRELRLFQQSTQARADEIANDESIEGTSPEVAAAVGTMEEQLVAAGRPKREAKHAASMVYAMAENLARNSGRKVEDVLAEMPSITGVGVATAKPDAAQGAAADVQTLKQPALEQMAAELRPVSADTLRQDFQALAPDEQQQRYFRDRNTGLANFRALETAWKDPSRQHLALFSLEGSKFLNDNFGHGSVDGALRAMADAVRQVAPDAGAKVGSDIGVMVRDEAQAKEVLDAMRRALPADVQVTYDIGARQETLKKTIDTVAGSHKAKRLTAEAAGTLAKRGDAPVALRGGDAKPVADKLTATAQPTVATPLSAEHGRAFAGDATAFETAHLDASGLLSDDGFAQARKNPKTRKKFVMSADLRGFGGMNEAFGREVTDGIKAFFSKRMFRMGAGRFDTANLHGDEYAAQGDDDAIMDAKFREWQQKLRQFVIWERNADGSVSYQAGVHFAYGIDPDEDIADRVKLREAKQQQDADGSVTGIEQADSFEEFDQVIRERGKSGGTPYVTLRGSDLARGADVVSGRRPSQADQVADAVVERLKQHDGDTHRGWIDIRRNGAKRQLDIFLTKNADASTFLHESSHAYLEMLGDIAEAPGALESAKSDWAKVRKWVGAEDGKPLTVEHKEKFARGFEAYLLEGKTPSGALAEAFASFRQWLKDIYKSAAALGVELDDNIRGVFDRMLATDQEIDRARTAAGLSQPVFSTPEQAGVDPKDFDAYLAAQARVRSDVTARTQRMIHEGELRAAKAYRTEEFKRLREQFTDEYDALPEVRAWRYMVMGEIALPDGKADRDTERGKLGRDEVVAILGKDSKLVGSLRGRLMKGGESPIDVAERFGFTQGAADMLRAVASRPDKDAWVKSEAERAMKDKHPEIDGEIADLQAAIQKLLHEDSYDEAERQWQLIKRHTADQMALEALQHAAKEKVANQAVGRLDPGVALNRERSFANQKAQAVAEHNWDRAMAFAHRQLLHKYMWRELVAAKDMRESFVDLVGDMLTEKSRKRLGLVSLEHRDVVDTLLEAIGATPERDTETPRKDLGALVAHMESVGDSVAFDADFIGELIRKPRAWKSLKVFELQAVLDALNNIKASARNGETLLMGGRRVDRDAFIGELLAAGADIVGTRAQLSTKDAGTIAENLSMSVDRFKLTNLRPETMLERFGEPGRAIVKMLQDAKHKKSDILAQTVKPISDVFDNIPKSVRARFQESIDGGALFPDFHDKALVPRRRYELITLAFNSGAVENINNLRDGNGITDAQRREALSLLTKEELEFVQAGWDAMESMWPLVRDLEERYSGVAPPRVVRVPMTITTSDGHTVNLRGGYFPIVHDNRGDTGFGQRAEIRNAAEVLDVALTRPGTSRSHTKRRTGAIEAISLEPSTFQLHIARVANDLAYREPLRAAVNILLHKDVKSILRTKLGKDAPSVFESWLRNIGQSVAAQAVLSDSWLWSARSKIPRAVLGFNVANLLGDLTGIVTPLIGTSVSKRHWAAAMTRYWLGLRMRSTREFALSKSGELRSRWTGDETYQGFQNRTRSLTQSRHQRFVSVLAEHAFFFHEQLEKAVITPLWDARYRQALDDGHSDDEAVGIANALVRQEFPAKSVVDKASIQTDKGVLGFMAMFSGFPNWVFNKYYRFWEPVGRAEGAKAKAFAATRALLAHIAFATVVGPLGELLVGRGPPPGGGDDEWERWGEWYVRKMVTAHLMPVPLVGGFIESVIDRRASTRFPALAAAEATVKAAQKIYAVATDDDNVDPEDAVLAAMRAYGFLTGAPTNAIARSLEYLLEGDYDNAGGIPSGLLYGDRKNKHGESVQPMNPISLFDQ